MNSSLHTVPSLIIFKELAAETVPFKADYSSALRFISFLRDIKLAAPAVI